MFTYNVPLWIAPRYLGLLVRTADLPGGHDGLCAASTTRLGVSPYRISTIGSRIFKVAACCSDASASLIL
jgi:hypothetical protein